MSRLRDWCVVLIAASVGCGGEDAVDRNTIDAAQVMAMSDAAVAPGASSDGSTAPAPLEAGALDTGTSNPALPEAGGITLGGKDAAMAGDAKGPIIVEIPTRTVSCGGSECTTTNNRTCCEGWGKATGFDGSPKCITKAQCESDHATFGNEANRVVESDCDQPGDCSGGQVCCFVRYGMPVTVDLFDTTLVGPGASRLCVDLSACNAGMMSISGVLGIPLGIVACKTAADCKDGTMCMPEQADSTSTGKGAAARPGVMVCR